MNAPLVFLPMDEMRPEELIEACKSPHWRLRHLYKIKNKDGQMVTIWVVSVNSRPSTNGVL
jgi:hypothetical protein